MTRGGEREKLTAVEAQREREREREKERESNIKAEKKETKNTFYPAIHAAISYM